VWLAAELLAETSLKKFILLLTYAVRQQDKEIKLND
jgi:hypothetical protein